MTAGHRSRSPGRGAPDIELHVEELVLHGVPPGQRHAIADQVMATLEAALAEQGLGAWTSGGAVIERATASLPAATAAPTAAPGAAPGAAIGHAIASILR